MKNYEECFADFEPWDGAMYTWNALQRYGKIGVLKAILRNAYFGGA